MNPNSETNTLNRRQPVDEIVSPLTLKPRVEKVGEIHCLDLKQRWKEMFDIDIAPSLDGLSQIDLFQCLDSGLRFFQPRSIAGTADLYAQLERFDWYYIPHKWEHASALKELRPQDNVLEVGCGFGGFLKTLKERNIRATGIELNRAAVRKANANGLDVQECSIDQIAKEYPESFDVVAHFEVLEHVADVRSFLKSCLECLRPGGRLIFAIPNMKSFIGSVEHFLLNQPPHHMSQWEPRTVKYLEQVFPMKLARMSFEPLAEYHCDFYLDQHWKRLYSKSERLWRLAKPHRAIGRRLLSWPMVRGLITGQTMYACFNKLG